MKNKIDDLRNHLFAQLERLGDEGLTGEALQAEIQRAKAMGQVAGQITDTARVEVEFLKVTGREDGSDFLPHDGAPRLGNGGRS